MLRKLLLLSFFCSFSIHAEKPLFSIVPVAGYPNKMTLAGNESAEVRYTVTNNVKQAQTIVFKPQAGLTPTYGSGNCDLKTTLSHNQSCTLILNVNGEGLSSIKGGPVMCQVLNNTTQPNPFFCSEPSPQDTLDITVLSNSYNLNVNVSNLPAGGAVTLKDGTTSAKYTASGTYTLKSNLNSGTSYVVSVTSANNAVCTVNNGVGTISGASATVNVVCASSSYLVGGVISGLSGTIKLLNNLQYSVTQSTNAAYNFLPVANGSSYSVTVASQPENQTCTVTNPSGTVNGANVSNANVYCASTTYTLGGTITGLPSGETVTLNSGVQSSTFSTNGSFTFPSSYASGTAYNVTITKQPVSVFCQVTASSGTLNSDVSNVSVSCQNIALSGQVYNLKSPIQVTTNISGVSSTQTISSNGAIFLGRLFNGATYSITVSSQASGQTCQIVNNSGTVSGASVSNVGIYCGDNNNLKNLGGTQFLSTLTFSPFILTLGSGISNIIYTNEGFFTTNSPQAYNFSTAVVPGVPYSLNVQAPTQASANFCILTDPTGTVKNQSITNANVWCGDKPGNTISGSLTGLPTGQSVVLTLGDTTVTETLSSNGAFTLSNLKIPRLASWKVTIAKQPTSAYCTLSNNSGTSQNGNVTNLGINCSTSSSTLVIQNTNIAVPINAVGSAIKVYNQGPSVVSDLVVNLPSAWLNVRQSPVSCNSLAVGATCTIDLNTTTPYPPASGITISGTNVGSSNAVNIAFLVNGNYVYNVRGTTPNAQGNIAYVALTFGGLTSSPMFNANMPSPTANLAVSPNDGSQNTTAWNTYYQNFAYGLPYQQCFSSDGKFYLPSACQWGPTGSTVNAQTCQGSGIYDLIRLGFITVDPNYYFWTSTQSSTTPTSVYAVNPNTGSMTTKTGTSSNYVICVGNESF